MPSTEMMNKGIVRASTIPTYIDNQEGYANVNMRGDFLTAMGLPEKTELTRLGAGVVIKTTAAVTLAVGAWPTTTASHYIYNGEPGGGKHYVIDKISWNCNTTSAGAATFFQMVACLGRASVTQPATTATLVAASLNGKRYGGRAGMGNAATIANDIWVPIGPTFTTALTTTIGMGVEAPINGGIIVPPGHLLSLDCLSVNATSSGAFTVTLYEVQLTNVIS